MLKHTQKNSIDTHLNRKVKNAMMSMTRQCWEQGITLQALLEIDDSNLDLVVYDTVTRQSEDGRLCNIENTPAVTDSSFCIPATMFVGNRKKEKAYLEAAEKNIKFLLYQAKRSKDGILFHMRGTSEIWADSAAFTPYALALSGHEKEAVFQMKGFMAKLYDKKSGMYFHIWDDATQTYKRKLLWGVGNGWILTGLLRLILELSTKMKPEKEELQAELIRLLDTMLSYITPNYLFHDILDRPNTFEESECSEMAAYTIFRGIYENVLDNRYYKMGCLIREAVIKQVDDNGLVKNCAGSPEFLYAGTSVEGQAHFLMMEQFYSKL